MRLLVLVALLVFLAGCSAAGDSGPEGGGGEETTSVPQETDETSTPETTETSTGDEVVIEQISSGTQGLQKRQILLASSADALSAATGVQVPDAGEGVYAAAFWGEKSTGGYSVNFISARKENGRVMVRLETNKPPPDVIVTQALTHPYAVAVMRNAALRGSEFSFVRENGQELRWPVRQA